MAVQLNGPLLEQLLDRNGLTSDPAIAARRTELLKRLKNVERWERVLKLATAGFVGVLLLLLGLFFWDHILEIFGGESLGLFPQDAEAPISIATLVCGVIAMPLLLLYFAQQRTARQIRLESRDLAMLELHEAIAELQRQISSARRLAKSSAGDKRTPAS